MPRYQVIKVESGACVYEYGADAPLDLAAWPAPAHRHDVLPEPVVEELAKPEQVWDHIDFVRRFKPEERIAARTAARTDPEVEDVLALLDGTPRVSNSDPDTVRGLQLLTLKGHLALGRMNEILYG